MTSIEKKVRSYMDGHEITLTEQQMKLLLHQCAGVGTNVYSNATEFASIVSHSVPPLAELREHFLGELYDELVRNCAPQQDQRAPDGPPSEVKDNQDDELSNLTEVSALLLLPIPHSLLRTPLENPEARLVPNDSTDSRSEITEDKKPKEKAEEELGCSSISAVVKKLMIDMGFVTECTLVVSTVFLFSSTGMSFLRALIVANARLAFVPMRKKPL